MSRNEILKALILLLSTSLLFACNQLKSDCESDYLLSQKQVEEICQTVADRYFWNIKDSIEAKAVIAQEKAECKLKYLAHRKNC